MPTAMERQLRMLPTTTCKEVGQWEKGTVLFFLTELLKKKSKLALPVLQLTPPYTPQHNGVSKRRNRTLLDMVRSMMNFTTSPLSFWDYALESATSILQYVPTKKVDIEPYELWYGKVPNLSCLKVWGCEALVKRDTPEKPEQRSVKCIFIGYPKETMGYYFIPTENKIWSERTRRATNRLCLNVEVEEHSLGDLGEPANYKAAMLDPESKKWVDAMNAEMQSMIDNMVWVLVDLPSNCKTIGSKWIFKKKTDMDGNVHIYKARLVAKGYTQTYMVDYKETFSPMADIRAIRILYL
ncbi:retrotransposon protein, putative, ty1-copia subclass [Tanacetum coccineum]